MKKIRTAIVGCGGIGVGKHMNNLAPIPEVELVAFCDIIEERAVQAAKKYGIPGAKVTTDYMEIANDPDIDVVHVCTPNRSHSFISIACLEGGKHVMCEKPMAKTAAEAKQMLETARRTGKKLTIGYQNRQYPDYQVVKRAAEAGEFGEIYFAKALSTRRRGVPTWGVFLNEYEQGGGPLIDIATHALDLTLWTMDNYEPEMVVGTKYRKLADTENAANPWGPWDPKKFTVEDSAFGFVRMKNGATIWLESSWAINMLDEKGCNFVLCGTKGGVDTSENGVRFNGEREGSMFTKLVQESHDVQFYPGYNGENSSESDMRQWTDAILNDTEPCVKPEQAYVVSLILDAIYESSKTGQPVYFEENVL